MRVPSPQTLDTTLSVVCDAPQTLDGTLRVASAAPGIRLLHLFETLNTTDAPPLGSIPHVWWSSITRFALIHLIERWGMTTPSFSASICARRS